MTRSSKKSPPASKPLSNAERVLADRILARRRLIQFVQKMHGSYEAGWVHKDICTRLERFSADVVAKKSPRLMLLVPPRHGKSEIASIRFPGWHLGQHPEHEIINVGYNLDLPMVFSRKVREMVRDQAYQNIFPGMQLDPDAQSVERWNTTKGGGLTAAGVGGGITGKGAHILIIDDPIKNQEEADSPEIRKKLLEWYQSTAYTRLAPGGGVLLIECMVGATPVLRPDGSETRLDQLLPGDVVATYEDGRRTTSIVAAVKQSGHDYVLKITTSSGRVVRANRRHPFLVFTPEGLKWIRARSLTTAHTIVAVPDNGVSGKGSSAPPKGVSSPRSAGGCALPTTTRKNGLMERVRRLLTLSPNAPRTSSIGMGSLLKSTIAFLKRKAVFVLSAVGSQRGRPQCIGATRFASTTATTPGSSEGCSATGATSPSDIFELSKMHSPWPSTFEFTTDQVASVEPDGEEEVFDVQIVGTENFIANGLVTHNTWWNDDDLAGRLQNLAKADPEADQFEVIKYPALSEAYEYRSRETFQITHSKNPIEDPNLELLRPPDTCLHEARYPTAALKKIRASGMDPRIWSALYQQNPIPDEGIFFKKTDFRFYITPPRLYDMNVYTGWDLAIGEKQQNDWTVGFSFAQDENNVWYVIDVTRFRGGTLEIVEAIVEVAERLSRQCNGRYTLGIEDGQIARAMIPSLELQMNESKFWPAYELLKPLTDKVARAKPLQGHMQRGRVYWPDPKTQPWAQQAVSELLRFPGGTNDDVVDAGAWAARMAIAAPPPVEETPPPPKSWKDQIDKLDRDSGSHMTA